VTAGRPSNKPGALNIYNEIEAPNAEKVRKMIEQWRKK
jgi:hypothetical protein